MTKKEFWLKLFSENDVALTSAIVLCERFASEEQIKHGQDYILEKKKELYEEVPEETIKAVFGSLQTETKVLTNLDIVKEMAAEKLAPFLMRFDDGLFLSPSGLENKSYEVVLDDIIKWLKTPVEGITNE